MRGTKNGTARDPQLVDIHVVVSLVQVVPISHGPHQLHKRSRVLWAGPDSPGFDGPVPLDMEYRVRVSLGPQGLPVESTFVHDPSDITCK